MSYSFIIIGVLIIKRYVSYRLIDQRCACCWEKKSRSKTFIYLLNCWLHSGGSSGLVEFRRFLCGNSAVRSIRSLERIFCNNNYVQIRFMCRNLQKYSIFSFCTNLAMKFIDPFNNIIPTVCDCGVVIKIWNHSEPQCSCQRIHSAVGVRMLSLNLFHFPICSNFSFPIRSQASYFMCCGK